MHKSNDKEVKQVADALQRGGIVVVRTDTLYGVIALAENKDAVAKVYAAKRRNPTKQCIVLLARDAQADNQRLTKYEHLIQAHSNAQTPTSVIVPASYEPSWLLNGEGDSVAYRFVNNAFLEAVIRAVGPVIAPSANPEGEPPARTIEEAKAYFGQAVDYYVDGGEVPVLTSASQVIKVLPGGKTVVIRP